MDSKNAFGFRGSLVIFIGANMTEILWHGRGGQGAFTVAKLLGAAYSLESDSNFSLAFPSFGPERRGAPILAFTKLDKKQIGDRSQIKKADCTIFLDDTLFSSAAFAEIKNGGKIFLNTKKSAAEFSDFGFSEKEISSLVLFDADTLAMKILGMPVTNTVMLALLAAENKVVNDENLKSAIKLYMAPKLYEKNAAVVDAVFSSVKTQSVQTAASAKAD